MNDTLDAFAGQLCGLVDWRLSSEETQDVLMVAKRVEGAGLGQLGGI